MVYSLLLEIALATVADSKNTDRVVLPVSMVEEIRALPISTANPTVAHAHNLLGTYTKMNLILRSNLHFRMIQTKLTPMLGMLTEPMEEEIKFALSNHFPRCEEWTTIKPYHAILDLVARTSARVFVGLPLCRTAEWLNISTQFTEEGEISCQKFLMEALLTRESLCERLFHALISYMGASSAC